MNRTKASAVLEQILSRQLPIGGDHLTKIAPQTKEEDDVLNCAARYIKGGAMFTDHGVFDDFFRALKQQKLIQASEKRELKNAKTAITLFVLLTMHNAKVDLGDRVTATISISADMRRNLGAFVRTEVSRDFDGRGAPTAVTWLFETGLSVQDHCESGTAPPDRSPFVGDFEMTPQGRLKRA